MSMRYHAEDSDSFDSLDFSNKSSFPTFSVFCVLLPKILSQPSAYLSGVPTLDLITSPVISFFDGTINSQRIQRQYKI